MKINLGDDDNADHKINWIRSTFNKDQYRIRDAGFIYPDYVIEFAEERYATLFTLKWG